MLIALTLFKRTYLPETVLFYLPKKFFVNGVSCYDHLPRHEVVHVTVVTVCKVVAKKVEMGIVVEGQVAVAQEADTRQVQ